MLRFHIKKGLIKMKRIVSFILCLATLLSTMAILALPTAAIEEPEINNIAGALVYNVENQKTVYKYKAEEKIFPTSTVKIMTGILAVEALGDRLEEKITVTKEMLSKVSGNNIKLEAGDVVTVKDMIWTLLVNGANDSAYVLAYTVSGSLEKFVTRMNTRAKELGAIHTNYVNPTGMHDENMYTTVADTAIIAQHAYTLPLFMECSSSMKYSMESFNHTVHNRNCLLTLYYDKNYFDSQARGMNAGSTPQGGHSVVTTATNGELSYIIVVMGGQTVEGTIYSYTTASQLIDWAFASFNYIEVLSPNQIICDIPVTLSSVTDMVNLVASDTLNIYLPADVDPETAIELSYVTYSEELQSPVTKGQVCGSVTAMYNGEILGTSDMITTADVARSELLYTFYKIEQFSKSKFFIATLVSAVILTIIYIFGNAYIRARRPKRRRY